VVAHGVSVASANKTGLSIYVMGINDKTYLANTYGEKIGKASVTGYCIKFKTLKEINIEILGAAIRYGFEAQNEKGGLMWQAHDDLQPGGRQTITWKKRLFPFLYNIYKFFIIDFICCL
jgi:hypothetical protein